MFIDDTAYNMSNWMGSENTADTIYLDSVRGMIRSRGLSVARMSKETWEIK